MAKTIKTVEGTEAEVTEETKGKRGKKTCPKCKKEWGARKTTCDCGHEFETKNKDASAPKPSKLKPVPPTTEELATATKSKIKMVAEFRSKDGRGRDGLAKLVSSVAESLNLLKTQFGSLEEAEESIKLFDDMAEFMKSTLKPKS